MTKKQIKEIDSEKLLNLYEDAVMQNVKDCNSQRGITKKGIKLELDLREELLKRLTGGN